MSSIDQDTVKKVAHQARLAISEEFIPEYLKSLCYVEQLAQQIEHPDITEAISHLPEMLHIFENKTPLHEDHTLPDSDTNTSAYHALSPEFMPSNHQNNQAGFYLVPSVVEES